MLEELNPRLITHTQNQTETVEDIKNRLKANQRQLWLPLEEEYALLEQLSHFELGQSLLQNRGVSGRWISYVILGAKEKNLKNPLEQWLIHDCPMVLATRERFWIFQDQFKTFIEPNSTWASIPCGTLDDLLKVEKEFTRVGVDLDEESIELAKMNAIAHQQQNKCQWMQKDAWNLEIKEEWHGLTSNGLNTYEPNYDRVVLLYQEFYKALKPKGIFIGSFIAKPPSQDSYSTWKNIHPENLRKQNAIFIDILNAKWLCFRSAQENKTQLQTAGFKLVDLIEDTQGMYPTFVAQKI